MSRVVQLTYRASWSSLALLLTLSLSFSGCGRDDEVESSHSRPWDYRYEYDHPVVFGYGGDAERHMRRGWSGLEPKHTWTDGPVAELGFRVRRCEEPVVLKVTTGAMIHPPDLPFQPVDVYVGDVKIASWQVAEPKTYTAEIRPRFTAPLEGAIYIRFEIPKATSPAELGQNGDARKLGLMVSEVTLQRVHPKLPEAARAYRYSDKIFFGAGGNAQKYFGEGWGSIEAESTWTDGTSAVLELTLAHSDGPVTLTIRAGGMHGRSRDAAQHGDVPFQRVNVSVGEQQIAQWQVSDEALLEAVIPQAAVAATQNAVRIHLSLPDATSPAELGHSNDRRKLGLRVFAATITRQGEASREKHATAAK